MYKLCSPGNAIQWSESGRKFSHGGIRPGGDVVYLKKKTIKWKLLSIVFVCCNIKKTCLEEGHIIMIWV